VTAVTVGYSLVCFDADGVERAATGGVTSASLLAADPAPTDIFFEIHGWKGDVPAAIDQYDRWFGALKAREADRAQLAALRPHGFVPMLVGLHWPSLPFGDEEMPAGPSFALPGEEDVETLVDAYVERLGDRPGLRDPLRVIVAQAFRGSPALMPADVRAAYERLDLLMAELAADGPTAPPGADNPPFDAPAIYDEVRGPASFGFDPFGTLLVPLQQLSFWKMKDRARRVGESGFHRLLGQLARAFPTAKLHVMGHSFGCIAASAAIVGPRGAAGNKVASLALVQGALSLWSYGSDNDYGSGHGYFERLVTNRLVDGPIVATISRFDRALSVLYPLGAAARRQIDFAPDALPRFGAIGNRGAHGLTQSARELVILNADAPYALDKGRLHNVEASGAIRNGGGLSGAHSDIDGPQVAHLVWSAAIAAG
jgi:hypothetical protein